MMRALVAGSCVALCVALTHTHAAEPTRDLQNWSRFRGPLGTGESSETELSSQFSTESVDWIAELPVRGHSSPIVWGNRVFLTGATADGGTVSRHVL